MIKRRTLGLMLGGACLGLLVAMTAILDRGADPGPMAIAAWINHHVTIADHEADLKATIALLDAIETVPAHQPAGTWSVAAVAGDGMDMTKRIKNIELGGRVKSASSLVTAPASRFSART
jgi:hypothetical protein